MKKTEFGRDVQGKFTKGNSFGRGRPPYGLKGELRKYLNKADRRKAIIEKLYQASINGDFKAINLLLYYDMGLRKNILR